MKKRLIIVSAGDFGRELAWVARSIPENQRDWEFAGFLDGRKDVLDNYPGAGEILGEPATFEPAPTDRFLCAVGDPKLRIHYASMVEARGGIFTTLIHPTALVGERTTINAGAILCPQVEVTTDVEIGRHALLMSKATVGHNARIGNGAVLSAFTFVGGHAILGDGVYLGPHAVVVPRKKVGDFATVGVGSVALRNVASRTTVFGVPAKVVNEPSTSLPKK